MDDAGASRWPGALKCTDGAQGSWPRFDLVLDVQDPGGGLPGIAGAAMGAVWNNVASSAITRPRP